MNPFDVIEARLETIENLIRELRAAQEPPETDTWLNLDELIEYLPDRPAKPTLYSWVSNGLIPYHKLMKRLYFRKTEIDGWLEAGRRKTFDELKK